MMRINLLPVKSAYKHTAIKNELAIVALGLAVVCVGLFFWHTNTESQINDVRNRIRLVQTEIDDLKLNVVRVEDFKKKAELLEQKINIIQNLKRSKVGPARLLDDLAVILSEEKKVWLLRLEENNGAMTLEGGAMEHENISEFQLALEQRSKYFRDVKLNLVHSTNKGGTTIVEWKITCRADYGAS